MTFRSPIKHCRDCGTAVAYRLPDDGDTKQRAVCPACHTVHYENPLNVVGTVPTLADGRVLLCKRNIEPRWGKWTLPAGFMELDETTAQGAARETDEEAGAQVLRIAEQAPWSQLAGFGLQLPRWHCPFLIMAAPCRYQQHLTALMRMPVVAAAGCKGNVGYGQGRTRWHKHVEPDLAAKVVILKSVTCGKYRFDRCLAHIVVLFDAAMKLPEKNSVYFSFKGALSANVWPEFLLRALEQLG